MPKIEREKLERWNSPLSPFVSIEEIYREMEEEVNLWGASFAPTLVELLVTLDNQGDCQIETLGEFIEFYARIYPNELADALLEKLCPTGPPSLVSLLGTTGKTQAIPQLKQVLDLSNARDELLEALVGTLGDIGGSEALKILSSLQTKANLSKKVQDEISFALTQLMGNNL